MATIEGHVTVFESSDGGTGDPVKTIWQFFVEAQPVRTENRFLAETMRLAVDTSSKVRVTYDENKSNTMSQARIEFTYVCESTRYAPCDKNPIPG